MGHSFEITKQLLYIQNSITNEVLNALQYIVDWELAHPENERTANDCEQLNKDLAAYEYRIKQNFVSIYVYISITSYYQIPWNVQY